MSVGGERPLLQDGVWGALTGVGCGGLVDRHRGQSPRPPRRYSQESCELLLSCSRQMYVPQFGHQVRRCYSFCHLAGRFLTKTPKQMYDDFLKDSKRSFGVSAQEKDSLERYNNSFLLLILLL